MKIEINKNYQLLDNREQKNNKKNTPSFKGPLDGVITSALTTIETNEMVDAALVDVFSMVIPRTYVDTKKRNKYAGAETLFRELTGTIIVCLSSGVVAKGISHLYNKFVKPEVKVNPNSWVGNDSLKVLTKSWEDSKADVGKYVSGVVSKLSGRDGYDISTWEKTDFSKVEWFDDNKWSNINWADSKYNNIQDRLKSKESIIETLKEVIGNKNIDKKDAKNVLDIIDHRLTNALKISSASVEFDKDTKLGASVKNIVRDIYDLGKNVFTNKEVSIEASLSKLKDMNKAKIFGALSIVSLLGLTNQYINRQITKKRTGTDKFVGDIDYKKVESQKSKQVEDKKEKNGFRLTGFKLLASAGIILLAKKVMGIKTLKDFTDKLEFTGPVTSGNAIKTIYTATLVGRFLASKNESELRESVTRDYLAFLNWLVFGGFVAKGVGHLVFGKDLPELFNINGDIKGVKNWLNNFSRKSHMEIAAKGTEFAKRNIVKANIMQASGLIYSTVALGVLIPLLNIAITKHEQKKKQKLQEQALNNQAIAA